MRHLLLIALISAGCSVYKSRGRGNFEGRITDNKKTGYVGMCWTQPRTEALWNAAEGSRYTVTSLPQDNSIEVCAADDVSTDDHIDFDRGLAGSLGR